MGKALALAASGNNPAAGLADCSRWLRYEVTKNYSVSHFLKKSIPATLSFSL